MHSMCEAFRGVGLLWLVFSMLDRLLTGSLTVAWSIGNVGGAVMLWLIGTVTEARLKWVTGLQQ